MVLHVCQTILHHRQDAEDAFQATFLEKRWRIESLLEKQRGPVRQPEILRALRAVVVLEEIATPEARKVLQKLASGAPDARLTQEAKASLERLAKRR